VSEEHIVGPFVSVCLYIAFYLRDRKPHDCGLLLCNNGNSWFLLPERNHAQQWRGYCWYALLYGNDLESH
jgi:hypothetical protein